MNHSILLILPYFGKLPSYFRLWLFSAANNPSIDFLLLIDDDSNYDFPPNVKVEYITFDDVVKRVRGCFDFPIYLSAPYKLCDFKPAYGLIFCDFLKDYQFWGHCDCDLIFGDIRKFVTDEILDRYDRIFEFGHLCIYRNIPDVNVLFMKKIPGIRYYKNVFSSKISQCFDEMCGATPIWRSLAPSKVYSEIVFDDILYKKRQFFRIPELSLPRLYRYEKNGSLQSIVKMGDTCLSSEICYAHFQKRKMKDEVNNPDNGFIICPNRFIDNNISISDAVFKKLNNKKPYLYPLVVKVKELKNKIVNTIGERKKG